MNEIKMTGIQEFMGINIPVIEGGFGINQKCISDKTISEIHGIAVFHVRESINKNINRFKENIDYIDLKGIDHTDTFDISSLGYSKQAVTQAKNIYLLSERGYSKLIKIMDSDKAWEVHDTLMDEYFSMREIIKNNLNEIDMAILSVVKSKSVEERMIAMQEYTEIIQKPLLATIETQKPKVELADKRIDKKGCISITDATEMFSFKKGQLTGWAKENGYLHKKLTEVNAIGKEYFKVYSSDNVHNQIGILDKGIELIRENENLIHEFKIKRISKKSDVKEIA